MPYTKWSLIINAIVTIGILISFFFYAPFFYSRIVVLIFAITEPLLLFYPTKIQKGTFWAYCSLVFLGILITLNLDGVSVFTEKTLYILIFLSILLIGTYKSIFNVNVKSE